MSHYCPETFFGQMADEWFYEASYYDSLWGDCFPSMVSDTQEREVGGTCSSNPETCVDPIVVGAKDAGLTPVSTVLVGDPRNPNHRIRYSRIMNKALSDYIHPRRTRPGYPDAVLGDMGTVFTPRQTCDCWIRVRLEDGPSSQERYRYFRVFRLVNPNISDGLPFLVGLELAGRPDDDSSRLADDRFDFAFGPDDKSTDDDDEVFFHRAEVATGINRYGGAYRETCALICKDRIQRIDVRKNQ